MKILYSLLLIIVTSCSNNITQDDLQNLNGYWDIEMVESEAKKIT